MSTQIAIPGDLHLHSSGLSLGQDRPAGLSAADVREWRLAVGVDSSFAALFWPWVRTDAAGGAPVGRGGSPRTLALR